MFGGDYRLPGDTGDDDDEDGDDGGAEEGIDDNFGDRTSTSFATSFNATTSLPTKHTWPGPRMDAGGQGQGQGQLPGKKMRYSFNDSRADSDAGATIGGRIVTGRGAKMRGRSRLEQAQTLEGRTLVLMDKLVAARDLAARKRR